MAKFCLLFPLLTLLNFPDIWCFRNSRMSFFPVLWLCFTNPSGVSFVLSFKFCHSPGLYSSSSLFSLPGTCSLIFKALILNEASIAQCLVPAPFLCCGTHRLLKENFFSHLLILKLSLLPSSHAPSLLPNGLQYAFLALVMQTLDGHFSKDIHLR